KLLKPGGRLLTFSCSGGLSRELFQKIVADAAVDAGVDAQILRWLGAASDHPVALGFPEGEYLKGLLCRVGARGHRRGTTHTTRHRHTGGGGSGASAPLLCSNVSPPSARPSSPFLPTPRAPQPP